MSDILRRLNNCTVGIDENGTIIELIEGAAAEIERLTASLKERDAEIESAYREGWHDGFDEGNGAMPDRTEVKDMWDASLSKMATLESGAP